MAAASAAAVPLLAEVPVKPVESHVHLFDPARVPYAPQAPYKPEPAPLEQYVAFAREAGIDRAVIVHPEPYQDDHRYLEYCFAHEPSPGFFKGTCLFDPIAPETPARMEALVKRNPKRIVALRIHEMHAPGTPSLTSGPIKDRDMNSPAMKDTWKKAQALGLGIQMHFLPYYAPQIGTLAAQFRDVPVILDHLARVGQGTPEDFENVLKLARYPRVYMKYSGVAYSSKQKFPYADAKPIVRKFFDAFGPDRMIWGTLGGKMADYRKQVELFEMMFDFGSAADREKIARTNSLKLFQW